MCHLLTFVLQVRAEERTAAKAALTQAIQHTKQQMDAKYSQGAQGVPQAAAGGPPMIGSATAP